MEVNSVIVEPGAVVSDQAADLREGAAARPPVSVSRRLRCIAVGGGKGGVGKTVVSVGLAMWLARMKYKVLIMDGDLGLANVDIQIGINPKLTMQDVVFGNCSIRDAVVHIENGPDVLAASSGAPEMVDMGNARRELFVEELVTFASEYDYLIIDVAAGIGKGITTFLSAAPEVLTVVANEPTSMMDAYSLIKVLRKNPEPPAIKLVVNMVRSFAEGEMLASRLNKIIQRFLGDEMPLAGVILYDRLVGDSIRARRSIVDYAPASQAAQCIQDLAKYVVSGRDYAAGSAQKMKETFFDKLTDIGMHVSGEKVQE